ncbi:MAG: outer membrane protein assembly factor BamD [Cytophagales bacterium]
MKIHIKVSFLFLLIIANLYFSHAIAQQDITTQYLAAKELLKAEKYEESIKSFAELGNNTPNDEFSAHCKYFTAYAYFKKNNFRDANFLLFQIINKYPTWEKLDFVYYLKGIVQLDGKNYVDALTQFSKIADRRLRKKADASILFYADKITTDSLIMLNLRFKDDKGLKDAYSKRTNTYKDAEIVTKPEWNVALLLPTELSAKNRFVYELNAGITLAQDSLAKMGVKINIHPFDTGKDTTGVLNFVSLRESACFDMVIGPLYSNQQKIINEYSVKHAVPVVNPLSNSFGLAASNPNYFLFQPSAETQGTVAAEFAYKNFTRKPTAIVVFGIGANDSLIAKAYKSQFEKLGGKVLKYKMLGKSNSGFFASFFSKIPIDSVGHIFVSSNESALAANVFTTLEGLLIDKAASYKETLINNMLDGEQKIERRLLVNDVPVFTSSKWLEFESISYEQFIMHNTHFIQNEYTQSDTISANFESRYFETYQIPASIYAKQGYSMILNFGIFLNAYGIYFPKFLSETTTQKSPTLSYQNYSTSKDNAFVPIVKIDNYQLMLVNKPDLQNAK